MHVDFFTLKSLKKMKITLSYPTENERLIALLSIQKNVPANLYTLKKYEAEEKFINMFINFSRPNEKTKLLNKYRLDIEATDIDALKKLNEIATGKNKITPLKAKKTATKKVVAPTKKRPFSSFPKTKKMPLKKATAKRKPATKKVVAKRKTAPKKKALTPAQKKVKELRKLLAIEKSKEAVLIRKNKANKKKLAKIRRTSKVVRKRKPTPKK